MIGPAGAGKSTLLHLLAGFDQPSAGTVTVAGHALSGLADHDVVRLRREQLGLLLPDAGIVPTVTVLDNVSSRCA